MAHAEQGLREVWLIEERPNPSTDFYLMPALATSGRVVQRYSHADLPSSSALTGAILVFVRYVPRTWARFVEQNRGRIERVIYFMDDDLLDPNATFGLPWRYRLKLMRLASWRAGWLQQQKSQVWVSTPYLQQKYASWQPSLVLPCPLPETTATRRVFYHGSSAHEAEINWLRPVMDAVLRQDERISFEIVGDAAVQRAYAKMPRVSVIHPMSWPAYQANQGLAGRHIGLAPSLGLPFNRARSYTKFFDITRCGAVGIYARNSAYGATLIHGVEGWIAADNSDEWIESILWLARDDQLRDELYRNALQKMGQLAEAARVCHSNLL